MLVIKERIIKDKLAQLILEDDIVTVNVIYNRVCIDSSIPVDKALLDIEVTSFK